jgi:hypothetical protein
LARWSIELSQWDYEVRYRKGSKNILADTHSRQQFRFKKYRVVSANPYEEPNIEIIGKRLYQKMVTSLNISEDDQWNVYLS